MDRVEISVLREFCPKLLCHWSEDRAVDFVGKCCDMSATGICWLWDWFLAQIKGNDPPSHKISLIIANFLLHKLPKSHKLPPFIPLKLITIHADSNIKQVSSVATEIANRNPSTAPSLLIKPLNKVLQFKIYDPDYSQLVSSLSYLLLKSLDKHNPKASYKAIESILACDIENLQRFFVIDNFLSLILFTVSTPFHKGMSTFYSTESYLKCLNLSQKIDIFTTRNYQHSIFHYLMHWSTQLSTRNISHLFYKIHDYYLNSLNIDTANVSSKFEYERDKLCFGAFIIALFCRNANSQSIDFFESLYLILCKSNEAGLFSFVPLDNDPLHIIKSIELPFKLFNLLLQIADDNNNNGEICKSVWKNIKLLFEINLHQIDLTHFVSLISKCFPINEQEFYTNASDSLHYVLDSFCHADNDIQLCDNIYLDTLIGLMSSLYKLGDLHTFFSTLSHNIPFYFVLCPGVVKIIQHCANDFTDNSKVFESLVQLLNSYSNDINLVLILRIFISAFLLSINIKDNLCSRNFLASFSKFISQINLQELAIDTNDLLNTSVYLFVLSLFVIIRKIEACFTYTSGYTRYNQVNHLTNILFAAERLVNFNSRLASYQLKLCGLSLVHVSLYYATRMFNNEDLWAIDPVTNLSEKLHKLSLQLSLDDVKHFYLLYMSNAHLFDIYGIRVPTNLAVISQILNEHPNLQVNPALITTLISEKDLCDILEPTALNSVNMSGISQLVACIENPTCNVLNRIVKCLNKTSDMRCKRVLLCTVEKLSHKKSLQQTIVCHLFNELIYPLDKQVCGNCQSKCQKLDEIKLSLGECESLLFAHLNDELCYILLEKSLNYVFHVHLKEHTNYDEIMVFLTYQLLRHLCNFEFPVHGATNCNYCGIHMKRKDVFLHAINALDLTCTANIFRNLPKHKMLEKYISLLLRESMKLENNLIAMKDYLNNSLSKESLDVCIGFIRLIAMDSTRQINPQLSLELLKKANELDLSPNNILSLGPTVGSVSALIEYLTLCTKNNGVINVDESLYYIVKNVMQSDHLKIGEDIISAVSTNFLQDTRSNVILKLFICDSVLKASRGIYNPSAKNKGELFNMVTRSFKNSLEFIINNCHLYDCGWIYVYFCKIVCSLYYRMRKSSLSTIGYINVHNHVVVCDILINLSTLAHKFKQYNAKLLARHSFMCIYSLLNYGNGASQAQILRLLNLWVNKIPNIIVSCKHLAKLSSGIDGVKLLLDIVKLMRNKKIIDSTKRYIPLLLTFILEQVRAMAIPTPGENEDLGGGENSWILLSIKRQVQLSLEACGPKIVQEWYYDLPNYLRIYLKQFGIKLSASSKYKSP